MINWIVFGRNRPHTNTHPNPKKEKIKIKSEILSFLLPTRIELVTSPFRLIRVARSPTELRELFCPKSAGLHNIFTNAYFSRTDSHDLLLHLLGPAMSSCLLILGKKGSKEFLKA